MLNLVFSISSKILVLRFPIQIEALRAYSVFSPRALTEMKNKYRQFKVKFYRNNRFTMISLGGKTKEL